MSEVSAPEAVWTATMASEDRPTRLLRAEQVGEIIGMAPSAVYRLAREHQIPTVRLGRYCRFRPQAIEKWLEAKES